jgi:hypothetical protein
VRSARVTIPNKDLLPFLPPELQRRAVLGSSYNLVDQKNNALKKEDCQFPYDYEYKVSPDIDKFLETNKIEKGR